MLHARRNQKQAAAERYLELCAIPCAAHWPVEAALEALEQAGLAAEARRALNQAIDLPGVHPRVGALWAQRAARGPWGMGQARKAAALVKRGDPLGAQTGVAYLEGWGTGNAGGDSDYSSRGTGSSSRTTWNCGGAVGYALIELGRDREAARWLAGWKNRAGARPCMLVNLVVALRNLARDDEAATVSEEALRLEPDDSTACHLVWLAGDAAIQGRAGAAREKLEKVDSSSLTRLYRLLHSVTQAMAGAEDAVARRDLDGIRAAENLLRAAPSGLTIASLPLAFRRVILGAMRRLARARGGLKGRLQALALAAHAATSRDLLRFALRRTGGRRG